MVSKLPQLFIERVARERYNQQFWENPIPEEHKLTDEDILKFVECLKPIAMQTMFSSMASNDQTSMVQSLALLCPSVMIPPIIERMYASLDSLTEPHKLTSCMISLVSVARPLVDGFRNGYKEGPTHILPLLYATLPGNKGQINILLFKYLRYKITYKMYKHFARDVVQFLLYDFFCDVFVPKVHFINFLFPKLKIGICSFV